MCGLRRPRMRSLCSFLLALTLVWSAHGQPSCSPFVGGWSPALLPRLSIYFTGDNAGSYVFVNTSTPCGVCITGSYSTSYKGISSRGYYEYAFVASASCFFNDSTCAAACIVPSAIYNPSLKSNTVTLSDVSPCNGWFAPNGLGYGRSSSASTSCPSGYSSTSSGLSATTSIAAATTSITSAAAHYPVSFLTVIVVLVIALLI